MNVEIGVEAALFPEKEYISGIFVAVHRKGGGGDLTREKVRRAIVHKAGQKYQHD
jgi:hypothetical protein